MYNVQLKKVKLKKDASLYLNPLSFPYLFICQFIHNVVSCSPLFLLNPN